MTVNSLGTGVVVSRLSTMRQQFEALQLQFSTGLKSETWGGLGTDRNVSIAFNQRLGVLESFAATISQTSLRMTLMDTSLDRLADIPTEIRTALDPNAFNVRSDGRTDGQKAAAIALDEVIGLLNIDADGRYLFSGQDTTTKPVVDLDTMLYGDGARAGLEQFVDERAMADLGAPDADGRHLGRLAVDAAGTTVTLAKPVATAFGFQLSGASGTLANVTITPTGAPPESLAFDFAGQPSPGQSVKLTLANPDGTTSTLTLEASATGSATNSFRIGATAEETAANFAAALEKGIAGLAETDLRAASAVAASDNFFDTANGGLPQRVVPVGGDFTAATTLGDADPADMVIWYVGQNDAGVDPRTGATAKVDSNLTVGYGARANEAGLAAVVKSLAVMAVSTFDPAVATDGQRYRALAERVRSDMSFPDQAPSPRGLQAEIAVVAKTVDLAAERNRTMQASFKDILAGAEQVNDEEIAAKLLALQTQMEASYQTVAMLSQLSLVNYV